MKWQWTKQCHQKLCLNSVSLQIVALLNRMAMTHCRLHLILSITDNTHTKRTDIAVKYIEFSLCEWIHFEIASNNGCKSSIRCIVSGCAAYTMQPICTQVKWQKALRNTYAHFLYSWLNNSVRQCALCVYGWPHNCVLPHGKFFFLSLLKS